MGKIGVGLIFPKDSKAILLYPTELKEAVRKASRNLWGKFEIVLTGPFYSDSLSYPFVILETPEDVPIDINHVGPRLRGIAQYLLKNYPFFSKYRNGYRLFNYVEVPPTVRANEEVEDD